MRADSRLRDWGQRLSTTGTTANAHTYGGDYVGYTQDPQAGPDSDFYLLGPRVLASQWHRFTTTDPITGGDPNEYRYAINNPINRSDPDGTDSFILEDQRHLSVDAKQREQFVGPIVERAPNENSLNATLGKNVVYLAEKLNGMGSLRKLSAAIARGWSFAENNQTLTSSHFEINEPEGLVTLNTRSIRETVDFRLLGPEVVTLNVDLTNLKATDIPYIAARPDTLFGIKRFREDLTTVTNKEYQLEYEREVISAVNAILNDPRLMQSPRSEERKQRRDRQLAGSDQHKEGVLPNGLGPRMQMTETGEIRDVNRNADPAALGTDPFFTQDQSAPFRPYRIPNKTQFVEGTPQELELDLQRRTRAIRESERDPVDKMVSSGQAGLGIAGLFIDVCDWINASIYLSRGKPKEAAVSAIGVGLAAAFGPLLKFSDELGSLADDAEDVSDLIVHGVAKELRDQERLAAELGIKKAPRRLSQLVPNGEIPWGSEGADFVKWFDDLSADELKVVLKEYDLGSFIRHPGGKHEWLKVEQLQKFKEWNVSMSEIWRFRTDTTKLVGTIPGTDTKFAHTIFNQRTGRLQTGPGAKMFDNELSELTRQSTSLSDFNKRLQQLAERWKIDSSLLPKPFPRATGG